MDGMADVARWLGRAGLSLLLVACAHGSPAGASGQTMTLSLPRAPAADEAVRLSLKVGRLPSGARVVVRTSGGEILGAVFPYGAEAARKGGTYVLAVPAGAVKDGKVSVELAVQEKGAPPRVPTKDEVQSVAVALSPATPLSTDDRR
jgi:hypothetical protein